jgi:hypothetical protein
MMALIAFGGTFGDPGFSNDSGCELDVDGAADALQRAGYEAFRLPDKYQGRLFHPLDDFIEVHFEADADDPKIINSIDKEINAIVDRRGGIVVESGAIGRDDVPFVDAFDGRD